jgi:pyruvate dehydrogenase E2 component (dihydrolipoamide acetyltransferase)
LDALIDVLVPDIGEFADVPVTELLVAVGDTVAAEDPLVVIESDKATMEIPSPVAGVVRELLVAVEDRVSEGSMIARLDGQAPSSDELARPGTITAPPDHSESAPEARASAPREATGEDPPSQANDASAPSSDGPERASVYAGPAVRRLARERGVDLREVAGTGRRGRITLEDLESHLHGSPRSSQVSTADSLNLVPWPRIDYAKFGEVDRVPLTRIQQISGANLARNWVRIPHVTHNESADITALEAFREELNAEQSAVKVTMVALLLKTVAAALIAFPHLNASLDGDELVIKRYLHLGFAADTPNGLVVPVVRDVDRKGLLQLAQELTELSGKAREGRLSPSEMSGSTFTISSLGGIGGTSFTPIINAPEVAILGVVRAATQPVWDGTQFQPRLILPLSLSYDHRVIDGAGAARFCRHLAQLLTDVRRLLL